MKNLIEFNNQKVKEAEEVLKRGFLLDGEEVIIIKNGWKVTYKNDGEKLSVNSCSTI